MQGMQHCVLPTRELCRSQEALLPSERDNGEQQSTTSGHTLAASRPVNLRRMWHQIRFHGQFGRPSGVLLSQKARTTGTSRKMSQVQGKVIIKV